MEKIAKFFSSINKDIPYSLLDFHPDWTSKMNKNVFKLSQIILSIIFNKLLVALVLIPLSHPLQEYLGILSILFSRNGNSFPQLRDTLGDDPMQN